MQESIANWLDLEQKLAAYLEVNQAAKSLGYSVPSLQHTLHQLIQQAITLRGQMNQDGLEEALRAKV